MRRLPPHFLLKSIDAACAYCSASGGRIASGPDLQAVVELFQLQDDNAKPKVLQSLHLHSLMLQFAREQFLIQESKGVVEVGRALHLFGSPTRTPTLDHAIRRSSGFSLSDWFAVHLGAFGRLTSRCLPFLDPEFERQNWSSILDMPDAHKQVLAEMTFTHAQVRSDYFTARHRDDWLSHSYLLPSAYERPLLQVDRIRWCPSAELVADHMMSGLLRQKTAVDVQGKADEEVHDSFVRYLADLAQIAWPTSALLHGEALKSIANGEKHCDLAVVSKDWTLLIEAKSFRRLPASVGAEGMSKHGMTSHLVSGLHQVPSSARHSRQIGDQVHVTRHSAAPVLGAVVVLHDLVFPNSEWFLREVVEARAARTTPFPDSWAPLAHRPAILNVGAFEKLAIHCLDSARPLTDIFTERAMANFAWHGDWEIALAKQLSTLPNALHQFWKAPFDGQMAQIKSRT